ncbi:hypothetical protein Moror_1544 [Moniliophthora roreri MCA 2997]|uniref:C2H2-type domain-containing protein n=2 Tax=Moniliophthora roreri TaxID=221103 RepID=V2XLE5_MONRO|nr:hypothetical protein Moror_1544 [Moniliophthora roreri MCA 2997]KAI3609536.1 hypothetical protein WG66_001224 [Moniliophthora roreri]
MTDYLNAYPLHPRPSTSDDIDLTINTDFILHTRCESALFDEQWRAARDSTTVGLVTSQSDDMDELDRNVHYTSSYLEVYPFSFASPTGDTPTSFTTPGLSTASSSSTSPFTSLDTPARSNPAWPVEALSSRHENTQVNSTETEADPEEIDALFQDLIHHSQILSEASGEQSASSKDGADSLYTLADSTSIAVEKSVERQPAVGCALPVRIRTPALEERADQEEDTPSSAQNLSSPSHDFSASQSPQSSPQDTSSSSRSIDPEVKFQGTGRLAASLPGSFWNFEVAGIPQCPVLACREEFSSEAELRRHMLIHSAPFSFRHCSSQSSSTKENRPCGKRRQNDPSPSKELFLSALGWSSQSMRHIKSSNDSVGIVGRQPTPSSLTVQGSVKLLPRFGSSSRNQVGCSHNSASNPSHVVGASSALDSFFKISQVISAEVAQRSSYTWPTIADYASAQASVGITVSPAALFDAAPTEFPEPMLTVIHNTIPPPSLLKADSSAAPQKQDCGSKAVPAKDEKSAKTTKSDPRGDELAEPEDLLPVGASVAKRRSMTPETPSINAPPCPKGAVVSSKATMVLRGTKRRRGKMRAPSPESFHLSKSSILHRPNYYESDMDVDEDSADKDFEDNDGDDDFYEPPRKLQKKDVVNVDRRKVSSSKPKIQKGAKRFPCPMAGCSQSFVRKCDLRRHRRDVRDALHGNEMAAGYRCERCGKVLSRADALKRHVDKEACGKRK